MRSVLAVLLLVSLTGCGRQWEQFWGQDTRPEVRYIPLTPDQFEVPIGPVVPFQWADGRFIRARYLNVWACRDDNACAALPQVDQDKNSLVFYVLDYKTAVITITGLGTITIGGIPPSKIRFQFVL